MSQLNQIEKITNEVFNKDKYKNSFNEVFVINSDDINKLNNEYLIFIKNNYKLFLIYCYEEIPNIHKLNELIQICTNINLPLYIFTKNIVFYKYFEKKYKNVNGIWVSRTKLAFNHDEFLIKHNKPLLHPDFNFNFQKNINLLFLSYNRRPNRDFIICNLHKNNKLYDDTNYISFYNYKSDQYENNYRQCLIDLEVDLDFLKNLNLIPNKNTNIDEQIKTQLESYQLYSKSKFNIISESVFGYGSDDTEYDFYNFILTKKTILPLLYKNVFFVHEYNNLFSNELKTLGFKLFFNSLSEFFNNNTDEYYYSEYAQEIINHNYNLVINLLSKNSSDLENDLTSILNEI
jgi:hypothetical protein